MSKEAEELHRIISTSVRDMLDAFRTQAQAGPVTDKALEQIIFRAAHGVEPCPVPRPAAGGDAAERSADVVDDLSGGGGGHGWLIKRGGGGVSIWQAGE